MESSADRRDLAVIDLSGEGGSVSRLRRSNERAGNVRAVAGRRHGRCMGRGAASESGNDQLRAAGVERADESTGPRPNAPMGRDGWKIARRSGSGDPKVAHAIE